MGNFELIVTFLGGSVVTSVLLHFLMPHFKFMKKLFGGSLQEVCDNITGCQDTDNSRDIRDISRYNVHN